MGLRTSQKAHPVPDLLGAPVHQECLGENARMIARSDILVACSPARARKPRVLHDRRRPPPPVASARVHLPALLSHHGAVFRHQGVDDAVCLLECGPSAAEGRPHHGSTFCTSLGHPPSCP
jgi:hypothetical protein